MGSDATRRLEQAQRVLRIEADAVQALAARIDDHFEAACQLCLACRGRIVVTGMGKSGHVASKIAATLASTGSPAFFLHPGEASHGDLGMITPDDVVLAISYSGETEEVLTILPLIKRLGAPLISMTGNAKSTLARQADVHLNVGVAEEACPLNLAPTASTTATLAFGDALAVALMERRGFSSDDYRILHPGGELGKSLIRVQDIMHEGADVPLVAHSAPMERAIKEITEKQLGCCGVIDDNGRLIGIITDGDLRRQIGEDVLSKQAHEVMTPDPRTIWEGAFAAEAVGLMNGPPRPITCLFVIGDPNDMAPKAGSKPTGVLHLHDCLRAGIS